MWERENLCVRTRAYLQGVRDDAAEAQLRRKALAELPRVAARGEDLRTEIGRMRESVGERERVCESVRECERA